LFHGAIIKLWSLLLVIVVHEDEDVLVHNILLLRHALKSREDLTINNVHHLLLRVPHKIRLLQVSIDILVKLVLALFF